MIYIGRWGRFTNRWGLWVLFCWGVFDLLRAWMGGSILLTEHFCDCGLQPWRSFEMYDWDYVFWNHMKAANGSSLFHNFHLRPQSSFFLVVFFRGGGTVPLMGGSPSLLATYLTSLPRWSAKWTLSGIADPLLLSALTLARAMLLSSKDSWGTLSGEMAAQMATEWIFCGDLYI